jgi:hypothetical protein
VTTHWVRSACTSGALTSSTMRRAISFVFLLLFTALASFGQSIAEKTKGFAAMPGYFPMYYDAKTGKLFLEVSRWNSDFLL